MKTWGISGAKSCQTVCNFPVLDLAIEILLYEAVDQNIAKTEVVKVDYMAVYIAIIE